MFGLSYKKIHEGDVYYSPKANAFLQVRQICEDHVLCGGMTTFYNDAKTTISTQPLSFKYVLGCKKVTTLDDMKEAELDPMINAWRVKERTKQNKGKEKKEVKDGI